MCNPRPVSAISGISAFLPFSLFASLLPRIYVGLVQKVNNFHKGVRVGKPLIPLTALTSA